MNNMINEVQRKIALTYIERSFYNTRTSLNDLIRNYYEDQNILNEAFIQINNGNVPNSEYLEIKKNKNVASRSIAIF